MSLFVINRYHGEEVDSSENRSRALLEKLHEQAKARQLQLQRQHQEERDIPGPKGSDRDTPRPIAKEAKRDTPSLKGAVRNIPTPSNKETPQRQQQEDRDTPILKGAARETPRPIPKAAKRDTTSLKGAVRSAPKPSDEEAEPETPQRKAKKRKKRQIEEVERPSAEDGKEEREEVERPSAEDGKGEREEVESPSAEDGKGQDSAPVKKKERRKKLDEEEQVESKEGKAAQTEGRGVEEASLDPRSILLGGFETKSVQKVLPVLPQWLAQPNLVQKDIKQNLVPIQQIPGVHPKLLKKLEANGVKCFFPVQAEVIPAILESACHGFLLGRGGFRPSDMCVSAPTGSGKTLAFVVPIVQTLLQRVVCEVRVLVVLPTKELAQQVCKVFNTYVDGTGLKVVVVTGQKSFPKEQESLVQRTVSGFRSLADILVSTPGRLVDHIQETEGFSLRQLRFLVIDEADRMIDSMNQDWLHHVTKAVYKGAAGAPSMLFSRREPGTLTAASSCVPQAPLQKLLFSATLTQNPEKLQQLGLYQPRLFTSMRKAPRADSSEGQSGEHIAANYSLPEGLTHYYIPCDMNAKPLILLHFLLTLRFSRVLCFTNSREASHRLFLLIRSFGRLTVAEFSSRLSPGERKRTLKEFEQGKLRLLISTDATARGIDVKGVTCVINYDAPQFIRTYIHRVGRTARAGKAGLAFTMLLKVQEQRYFRMMRDAGAPELQKQLVRSQNLQQFVQQYEEALVQLQRAVKDERAQKRS